MIYIVNCSFHEHVYNYISVIISPKVSFLSACMYVFNSETGRFVQIHIKNTDFLLA
jgi:hypothetical protein